MNTLKSGYEKGNPDETVNVKTIIPDWHISINTFFIDKDKRMNPNLKL